MARSTRKASEFTLVADCAETAMDPRNEALARMATAVCKKDARRTIANAREAGIELDAFLAESVHRAGVFGTLFGLMSVDLHENTGKFMDAIVKEMDGRGVSQPLKHQYTLENVSPDTLTRDRYMRADNDIHGSAGHRLAAHAEDWNGILKNRIPARNLMETATVQLWRGILSSPNRDGKASAASLAEKNPIMSANRNWTQWFREHTSTAETDSLGTGIGLAITIGTGWGITPNGEDTPQAILNTLAQISDAPKGTWTQPDHIGLSADTLIRMRVKDGKSQGWNRIDPEILNPGKQTNPSIPDIENAPIDPQELETLKSRHRQFYGNLGAKWNRKPLAWTGILDPKQDNRENRTAMIFRAMEAALHSGTEADMFLRATEAAHNAGMDVTQIAARQKTGYLIGPVQNLVAWAISQNTKVAFDLGIQLLERHAWKREDLESSPVYQIKTFEKESPEKIRGSTIPQAMIMHLLIDRADNAANRKLTDRVTKLFDWNTAPGSNGSLATMGLMKRIREYLDLSMNDSRNANALRWIARNCRPETFLIKDPHGQTMEQILNDMASAAENGSNTETLTAVGELRSMLIKHGIGLRNGVTQEADGTDPDIEKPGMTRNAIPGPATQTGAPGMRRSHG